MTLWELRACIEGYNLANGGEAKPEAMSGTDFDLFLESNSQFIADGITTDGRFT